jgi:type II secretory pathway pseudopilin PulG
MKRTSGLTLFEALITMGLISLTLALTAGLMRLYSQGARVKGAQGAGFDALRAVLHQVRSEAVGAVSFQTPASASSVWSPVLVFSKVDRSVDTRLEDFPLGWTPYDLTSTALPNDFLVGVRYEKVEDRLQRGFRSAGDSSWTNSSILERELVSFGCRLGSDRTVELRIELLGRAKNPVFTSKSMRRVP